MFDFTTVKAIYVPAFYVCDGSEHGICEATFDGMLYKIYINSARANSVIMYLNGHFYAITSGIDITQPDVQITVDDPLPAPDAPQEIELKDEGGSGSSTIVVFDTPEIEVIPGTKIEYNVQKTGDDVVVTYRVSGTEEWIEIPVLTEEDVLRIENGIKIISANITQSGTTVRLT